MKRLVLIFMGVLLLISLSLGFDHCAEYRSEYYIPKMENDSVNNNIKEEGDDSGKVITEYPVEQNMEKIQLKERKDTFPNVRLVNSCVKVKRQDCWLSTFMHKRDYEVESRDSLCVDASRQYVFMTDRLSRTKILYLGNKILLEDPSLSVSRINDSLFWVETASCSRTIDFSKKRNLRRLQDFDKRDSLFYRFTKDYRAHTSRKDQETAYTFSMDFPSDAYPYEKTIKRWLMEMVNESHVGYFLFVDSASYEDFHKTFPGGWCYHKNTITPKLLGAFASRRFFELKKQEFPEAEDALALLSAVHDWRLCVSTDRFLTYQYYFFSNEGENEDYYSLLRSYDLVHNKRIDLEYIFKPECLDSVKSLLLDEALYHERFRKEGYVETMAQLYRSFTSDAKYSRSEVIKYMMLPNVGLSEEGVVFSYRPYEINFSGCFHFMIPYGKLLPYLTDEAKWCLKIK